MNQRKVLRRIRRLEPRPDGLSVVARDIGIGLARGEREELRDVGRELAAHAPEGGEADDGYWAGFAAALGMVLAAYESAHAEDDRHAAALQVLSSSSAEAVLVALCMSPATDVELADRLDMTLGGMARVLQVLRSAGLVRAFGDRAAGDRDEMPERGAPGLHGLTPLGASVARECARRAEPVLAVAQAAAP